MTVLYFFRAVTAGSGFSGKLVSCTGDIVTSVRTSPIPALTGRGYNPWREPGDSTANEIARTAY